MPYIYENLKKPKYWIWLILVFDLFYKALINYLHLPNSINYFNDVACLILLHSIIMTYRRVYVIRESAFQLKILLLLFVETVFSYLINLYSPLTYLWGIRILFRFMIFFIACTLYADAKMLEDFFTLIFYVLIMSVVLTTLQKAAGYDLDSVTAFFSPGKNIGGGSAGLNIFMCIVCTYYYVFAINKKCQLYKCVISLIACVYMAAISELKMFYFELIIIIIFASLFSKISFKKIIGSLSGIIVVLFGIKIYDFYYGDRNSLDFSTMLDYAGANGSTYGAEYALNRLTAVPYVWTNILDDIIKKLFGLGIGYTDLITSSVLSSGFLNRYGNLGFHLWGMSLELANLGLIGLCFYLTFLFSVYIFANRAQKRDSNNICYYIICKIIVLIAIITLFYNTSLILDITAPFLYFIMAIPFILTNPKFKTKT